MDPGGYLSHLAIQNLLTIIQPAFTLTVGFITECIVLTVLLLASGFVSGAETAFFGISQVQLTGLKDATLTSSKLVYKLLEKPKRLLATLLILVNFINLAIVVLSSLMISHVFDFTNHPYWGFFIQVVAVTFVIVLFCEVMPKVYATQRSLRFAQVSVFIVYVFEKILSPLSSLLVLSTSLVDKRISKKGYDVSVDELTHAIDVTTDKNTPEDEKKILKGIARFGNTDVRQIMKPRLDVVAIVNDMPFPDLISLIIENKYSRIPVYQNSFDEIIGLLYIKDLLPHLEMKNDAGFNWQGLLRPGYFVPESKKINDLLQEFQEKKIHLAVVVDEYGGNSGIVTMEDVLEEIVGEINDEFDEEELFYSKLDNLNYVFEGKTPLNDLCRIMEIDRKLFVLEEKEDADTLAGFLLSLKGGIPQRNEILSHNSLKFTVESADRKRIKRVKISLPEITENATTGGDVLTSWLLPLLLSFMLISCGDDYVPKPRGYFRIALPQKTYTVFSPADCPYSFDIPSYSMAVKDTLQRAEPCWYNIVFPEFKATLYVSYKTVHGNLARYMEDSRTLSMKHIPKASGMEEEYINDAAEKKFGVIYDVKGSAASSIQFFMSDSTKNFIRGSLYFYAVPNPDSLAPVEQFLSADVRHLISSFHWK